jgi:hypothetical protein
MRSRRHDAGYDTPLRRIRLNLVPSERAVLSQIRDLFLEATARTYRLALLTARWPALHYDAYRSGYSGLINKGLISGSVDGPVFTITNAGMKAML